LHEEPSSNPRISARYRRTRPSRSDRQYSHHVPVRRPISDERGYCQADPWWLGLFL